MIGGETDWIYFEKKLMRKNMKRMVHWVAKSSDKKIGKVMASYSPKESCPDSCELKEGGCYAWGLFYLRNLGKKIKDGVLSTSIDDAFNKSNKSAKIVRHRVAGDCVGDQEQTLEECKYVEKKGLINIGYTHDWRSPKTQILKEYFRASCSSIDEIKEAREKGWGVTMIVPKGTPNKIILENGDRAIMCPVVKAEKKIDEDVKEILSKKEFETKKERRTFMLSTKKEMKEAMFKKMNCNVCTLCKISEKTKDIAVMFEIHGSPETLKKAIGKYESVE